MTPWSMASLITTHSEEHTKSQIKRMESILKTAYKQLSKCSKVDGHNAAETQLRQNWIHLIYISQINWKKLDTSPLNGNGDLIEWSIVVRYLGGYLNKNLTFKDHIKEKTRRAMANIIKFKVNVKIPQSRCNHTFSAHALHISPRLCKCDALQHTWKKH